jgi:AbrB family looped-hinge helix DNA binding protein
MTIAKISEKGQLTLPVDVRKKLNITSGSYVRIVLSDEEIRLIPETKNVSSLRGIVKVSEEQDFSAIRHQTMQEAVHDKNKRN